MNSRKVLAARDFALKAHGDQKYGNHDYSYHLDGVHQILKSFENDTLEIIGYLHDVVEDTDISLNDLETAFGTHVAQCVDLLTDLDGNDRKEKKKKTYHRLSQVQKDLSDALIVKTADRLANLRECVIGGNRKKMDMYLVEAKLFKKSVFRPGLCNDLWDEIDQIVESYIS